LKFYDQRSGAEVDSNGVQATCWSNILCGSICHNNSMPQITTSLPTTDESQSPLTVISNDTTITTITIVLAVVVGIVVIAVILLIVLLFRQHKTNKQITKDRSASKFNCTVNLESLFNFCNC